MAGKLLKRQLRTDDGIAVNPHPAKAAVTRNQYTWHAAAEIHWPCESLLFTPNMREPKQDPLHHGLMLMKVKVSMHVITGVVTGQKQ